MVYIHNDQSDIMVREARPLLYLVVCVFYRGGRTPELRRSADVSSSSRSALSRGTGLGPRRLLRNNYVDYEYDSNKMQRSISQVCLYSKSTLS